MILRKSLAALVCAVVLTLNFFPIAAQGQTTLDRTKIPPAGKTPELRVPTWTKSTLANSATLIVSERHDLPLVSFSITFVGGSNQFEPENRRGLGPLTSSMLSEGTTTKTGDQLSDALQLLGSTINANIGAEEGSISFLSTRRDRKSVV